MLLDSLPCKARVFSFLSNFRNMLEKEKPSLPSLRSSFFQTFWVFLHCRCQGDKWNTELENVANHLPAFQAVYDLRCHNTKPRMFWKLHWGASTTEDQTTGRCWLCLPPSAQGQQVPSHLLRYLRWVLKCANVAWWDIKIRLLCHVAPQQKDIWYLGIISLIPLKPNHFLQRWYQYLLCVLPISNLF